MSYTMIEDYTSPNQSPRSFFGWSGNPDGLVWHWWNTPAQAGTFESTINFFCSQSAGTSAHFIVSDKRVACIVSPTEAAWHAGNSEANGRTIGIEVDPRLPGDTLETCAELAADMERQFGSLNHYGHKDWTQTECPGILYDKIPWLIDRTNEILGNGGGGSSAPASSGSSSSIEAAIQWFANREGQVTYSMDYRMGPNSYDCSSSVYFALVAGGFLPAGSMGNTETLFGDLEAHGWHQVPATANGIPAQRGDVFIWGQRGASSGAAGHTGIFIDPDNIYNCQYGRNGIVIDNHDALWLGAGAMPCTIYRPPASTVSANNNTYTVKGDWFDMASEQDLRNAVLAVLRSKEFNDIIRSNVHNVLWYEKPGEFQGRTLPQMLQAIDRATWNTKKMTRYLFNQFRIGTPGVMTDGRLGGKVRKLLGYNEAEDGNARRDEWNADSKRQYDF